MSLIYYQFTMSKSKTPAKIAAKARKNINDLIATYQKHFATNAAKNGAAFFALLMLTAIGAAFFLHLTPAAIAMAGIKYALLYACPDGSVKSGRAGSVVYMRNGRRRNFVVPSLVRNAYTQLQRSSFQAQSAAFRSLSYLQQATWNSANDIYKSNRFGVPVLIKGKSLFVMCNRNLDLVGATNIDVFPANHPAPESVESITASYDPGLAHTFAMDASLQGGVTTLPADTSFALYATGMLSQGVSRPKQSSFRLIQVLAPAASLSSVNILTAYEAKFGPIATNARIYLQARTIFGTSGVASALAQCECVEL